MNARPPVYLDYAATAPLHPEVLKRYQEALTDGAQFNPSSPHAQGRHAKALLENARERVAAHFKVSPDSVVFCSGATESNHLALWGLTAILKDGVSLVTSATEHPSVLAALQSQPYIQAPVKILPAHGDGTLKISTLEEALQNNPGLVSIMAANNETGVCQDIERISELCKAAAVPFHCDAVQAIHHLCGPTLAQRCDLISFTGHKLGAPRGIGALIITEPAREMGVLLGGGQQERGRRSGTENVAGAQALAAALELKRVSWEELEASRNSWEEKLRAAFASVLIHGQKAKRLPGFSCFSIPGSVGEALLRFLDARGISVSTGSACSTGKKTASPVILAMTDDQDLARSSLRLSFGEPFEESMQKHVLRTIKEGIEHLRRVQGGLC